MSKISNALGLALCLATLSFFAPAPVFAWDVSIGTNFLDGALYVGSGSGTLPEWTTIEQRVRASDMPGPTIENNWVTQSWDPMTEIWDFEEFTTFQGITNAVIYNDDLEYEYWGSAEAFAFGSVPAGDAAGAAVGYDFEFVMQPFTTATIVLDELETYVYMASDPGDVGTAFGRARLYSTDIDVDDPGGANMPWAQDLYSIEAGDAPIDTQPSFSAFFSNTTPSPVTYNFRFEASVSVFAVPEPAMGAALCVGALGLAGLGSRRRGSLSA